MNIFRTMVKENKKEYIKVSEVTILGQKCELKVAYKNVKSAEVNFEYREIKVALPLKYKNKDITKILNVILNKKKWQNAIKKKK